MFSLMKEAAEAGSPEATAALGTFYDYGLGTKKSASRAVKLYREAASSANSDAQYNLGLALYEGRGVKRDQSEAVRWFQKAACKGLPEAKHQLGYCYRLIWACTRCTSSGLWISRFMGLPSFHRSVLAQFALKLLYLALRNHSKKWSTVQSWREVLNRFQILWPERMPALERRGS
jgi:TPR repeat protein